MIWNQLYQSLSFDKVALSCLTIGCTWSLYMADQEGRASLRRQLLTSECENRGVSRIHLTPSRCRELEQRGFLVIDNFLSMEEVMAARKCALDLSYQQSPNERDGDTVRTDKVHFFERRLDTVLMETSSNEALHHVQDQLHRVGYDISQSNFHGFNNKNNNSSNNNNNNDDDGDDTDDYTSEHRQLSVPSMMQVSLYDGEKPHDATTTTTTTDAATDAKSPKGAFYVSHLDTCSDSFLSLGLSGWLRSRYLRRRYITCIVYLNPFWKEENGGCLRMIEKDGTNFVDIEPQAGRLVLFSSVNMWHAVLPTFAPRLACSVWLTLN